MAKWRLDIAQNFCGFPSLGAAGLLHLLLGAGQACTDRSLECPAQDQSISLGSRRPDVLAKPGDLPPCRMRAEGGLALSRVCTLLQEPSLGVGGGGGAEERHPVSQGSVSRIPGPTHALARAQLLGLPQNHRIGRPCLEAPRGCGGSWCGEDSVMGVPFWAWNRSGRDRGQGLTHSPSQSWVRLQRPESGLLSPETGVEVQRVAPAGSRACPRGPWCRHPLVLAVSALGSTLHRALVRH